MEEIIDILRRLITNPESELEFTSNYELMVAVMLSAQCTDKRVNMVTKELFKVANTPKDMLKLSVEELEFTIF